MVKVPNRIPFLKETFIKNASDFPERLDLPQIIIPFPFLTSF